ncbi:MAG: hypothetical protein FD143_413 [Ignavibacteria bacterium]|nr:MAG: hypothetical protein FD143_413 [Ignavibacteria bacterium]KAF0160347.1 MAG: hypothetical protein FD188_1849 [Ignavibacteria bacterium]
MKTIVSKVFRFKTLFLFILMSTLISVSNAYSQSKDLDNEILVYFLPDSLEIPLKVAELTDASKLIIKSKKLESALKKLSITNIKKAFPDFNAKDTIRITSKNEKIKLPNMSRVFRIKLKDKEDAKLASETLSKENGVLFAEQNGYASSDLIPSDNRFNEQYSLNNTGQTGGTFDADIDAPEAWNIFTGSSLIKVGIIDTGVDGNHPDLSGKVSGSQIQYDEHGTHVAGICAARANNLYNNQNYGVVGVDWNALLVSKAFNDAKSTGDPYLYQIINEAVNEGANIINNSWKLLFDNSQAGRYSTTVRMAFANAYKQNVVAVASSGNTGDKGNIYQYPGGFGQGIITVAATDHNDQWAPFSTYKNYVDVSAPGSDILSTIPGTGFASFSGTSMATPHVSGIASLLKGYNPNLYNDDIEYIIRHSAEDKGTTGWDQYYGTGRVNAYKALQFLQSPYQLNQLSAYGGTDYGSTGTFNTIIYGASGLADGVYIVKRHDVRKTIYFSPMYDHYAWGRGIGSTGWSIESPNFAMPYCDVVEGTLTTNSVQLRTYVYEVWNIAYQFVGWYPTTPSNVTFNYTVLGKPLIAPVISSITQTPNPIGSGVTGTATANLSQGSGNISYSWSYINKPSWVSLSFSGNVAYITNDYVLQKTTSIQQGALAPAFTFTCVASNSAGSSTMSYQPYLDNSLSGNQLVNNKLNVEETKLDQNYPNPFNPVTTIKYQLKEKSYVSLKVYDIMGREVAMLINTKQESGYYSVPFNGASLSSGVYICILKTNDITISKKILLTK